MESNTNTAAELHAAFSPALLLSAIVDSSDDAIFSKALNGTITSWNRAAERIFGYTAREIIGRTALTLIPEHLHAQEKAVLARVATGQRVEPYESVRCNKRGNCLPVSVTLSPVRSESGEILGASTIARDISVQKHAMHAAHWLAAIVDSADDAIISKSLDGTITSWNKAAQVIFGYTAEEIVGRSVLTLIPPELQHEEPVILARLQRNERIEHFETKRVRKDGQRIDVSLTISPIRNAEGKVIGASKLARDITRQKKAEHATRLLAAIVDSSDDAIISKNLDGIVTSWNRGAQRIFGYTAEEMIGQPVCRLFPADRMDEEPQIIAKLMRGERVDHYRTIRVRKNGEPFHVSLTISPIRDASGQVIGASKVARDVTHEMKAMEQLGRANEELKRADRMKSEFLAVMSHELRTPLNSIIGFAAVLRQGRAGPLTDDQKKQLNLIHASGKHLLNLINDLLDLSRIEAGRTEIELDEFSPADVIQEAVNTLTVQAARKGIDLRWTADVPRTIHTDRKRLLQILLNLLSNAVKFTPRGHVELRAWSERDELFVSVTDTGIGIAREQQGSLFRPFSQVEGSSRRRFEGTGLGLYLCKKLLGLLGGDITMVSEANRGSTFTFHLPLQASLPAPQSAAAAESVLA